MCVLPHVQTTVLAEVCSGVFNHGIMPANYFLNWQFNAFSFSCVGHVQVICRFTTFVPGLSQGKKRIIGKVKEAICILKQNTYLILLLLQVGCHITGKL